MRFGEASWLWLLLLLPPTVLLVLWGLRRRERDLARWCDPALWNRMIADRRRLIGYWKAGLLILALFFLVLMAARPQLGSRILSVKRKGIDVMVALDCSESMLAEDLPPNRITRARQEIQALIDRMRGDRIGLVAFAGEAFVQCPLTLDYAAARMFLRFMDTDLIPVPGTAIAEAVRAGVRSFDPKERKFKALVLITDGEDHEGNLKEAAQEAKEQGVRVFAVGIGSTKGEPIPMADSKGGVRDYKRDREGNVVMTRLDPTALRDMCEETGGHLYDGNAGTLALDRLYAEISGMEQKELKGGIVTQYEDRYGYFAAAALALLTLEWVLSEKRRRRSAAGFWGRSSAGKKMALLLLLLLAGWLVPARAPAADKGTKAYLKGNYAAARDAYEQFTREHPNDPRGDYDLGTAMHQTGEMGPAEETLRRALRAPDPKLRGAAFYNLGNTRARAGNLQGALEAYEMALRLTPKDKDAKHNLELVRTLMQQQPPDSSKQQQQQQQKKDQQKDQKDQSGKNQQQDQQKKQDQKDQQQQDKKENEQKQQEQQSQQKQSDQQKHQEQQKQQEQGDQEKPATPLKISPEQARQILNGLAQQEMVLQKERLRAKSRELRVEKDW